MKLCLLISAGLLALVAGCTTTPVEVSHAPMAADAHFTIPYLELSQVDVPPQPIKTAPARLAILNAERDHSGYVKVQFIVDAAGIPREVQWVEASDAVFARAAVAATAKWRFSPAKRDGRPVAVKMELPFAYQWSAVAFRGPRYDDLSAGSVPNRYDASGTFVSNYQHQ